MTHLRVVGDKKFSLVSHHPISAHGLMRPRYVSPPTGSICAPLPEICTNQYLHRRSAGQNIPLSYHLSVPLENRAPSHPSLRRDLEHPFPRFCDPSAWFDLPHARTSSCLTQVDVKTCSRGLSWLPHSYRESET